MSSRPLRVDEQQVAADRLVGDMLVDDADAATDIRHSTWQNRIIGGDPDTIAAAADPKVLKTHTRLNPELANALTAIATRNGISREQLIREVLAAHAAHVLGVPIEPFLIRTQRTGPYYAKHWKPTP